MAVEYDKYYQTENLFGKPYPELIAFYNSIEKKGKLLDLGCGQGRDAIPLAILGFDVTGIDNSKVGIAQLNDFAKREKLSLIGLVEDIYTYSNFAQFDFILLDSMFHFGKKEILKETELLNRIVSASKLHALITICIQKTGKKIKQLSSIITQRNDLQLISKTKLIYNYVDQESNHSSKTTYEMVVIKKTRSI